MAYTVHTITSVTEIPALWASFAASVGFTVDTSIPAAPTIKHPGFAGGLPFRMQTAISGSNHDIRVDSATVVTNVSVTRSPILNPTLVTGAWAVVLPTKVHFIGNTSGEPFLATVVEYGFNLYRHVYVGYMEKSASYTGGEVISGSNFCPTELSSGAAVNAYNALRSINQPPFCVTDNLEAGGVRVAHAKSPSVWRRFFASGTTSGSDINTYASTSRGSTVLGGWRDSVNTGYANSGQSNFASAAILTPINLLITTNSSGKTGFQQIGRVSGARMVNVRNIEPGAQVAVGSSNWIVFPVFSKRSDPTFQQGAVAVGSRWPNINNSSHEGMAYRIN